MTDSTLSGFVLHIGADVSAKKVSLAWVTLHAQSDQAFEALLTPMGMDGLSQRLLSLQPAPSGIHVTLEVTANYHIRLAHFLYAQGFAVSVINPIQARRYAQLFLQRDKTDALSRTSRVGFFRVFDDGWGGNVTFAIAQNDIEGGVDVPGFIASRSSHFRS